MHRSSRRGLVQVVPRLSALCLDVRRALAVLKGSRRQQRALAEAEPSIRPVRFEGLEPRLLLSADIVPALSSLGPTQPLLPSDALIQEVVIQNAGDQAVPSGFVIDLYGSLSGVRGSGDPRLASIVTTDLVPAGGSISLSANLDLSSLTPGVYSIIAEADVGDIVGESNESNNVATGDSQIEMIWQFGDVGDRVQPVVLRLEDADGSEVTFSLTGAGTGEVALTPDGFDLTVHGTSATSVVTVSVVGGDGKTILQDVLIDGGLAAFNAPRAMLSGAFEGDAMGTVLLMATDDTASSSVDAVSLQRLIVEGNFAAHLNLTGNASTPLVLAQAQIGGAVAGVWNVHGRVGQLNVGSTTDAWFASFAEPIGSLVSAGDLSGRLYAPSLGVLQVGGNLQGAQLVIGADLGSDGQLGGSGTAADMFSAGNLSRVRVGGSVIDSRVWVGIDPVDGIFDNGNDRLAPGPGGEIREIAVGGLISALSSIASQLLPVITRVNQSSVPTTTLPQIVTRPQDRVAPTIEAGLAHDSGSSASDRITNDATIEGRVLDFSTIASFRVGLDQTPAAEFVEAKQHLLADGSFALDPTFLAQLAGGTLTDGAHTLHLRATDSAGNLSPITDLAFTLDTTAPAALSFGLALSSDSGLVGDDETNAARVTLTGATEAGTVLTLDAPAMQTLAGLTGGFQFAEVGLTQGINVLRVQARDAAGNTRTLERSISRSGIVSADAVLGWNQQALEAIRIAVSRPSEATRVLALVSLAQYDTIAAIEGTPAFMVQRTVAGSVSAEAAVAQAAHTVLRALFPARRAVFDAALTQQLADIPASDAKTNAINLGRDIANAILALRANDGADDFVDYPGSTQIGYWRPTAPMFDVAENPQWADVTPFALQSPDQFRAEAPPALDSAEYAESVEEIRRLGSATSAARTADQTQTAHFWADGKGSYTPPGHWNVIAQQMALAEGNSLTANVRLFAQLNVALADASVAAWDTKYLYGLWRPLDAIAHADEDGNAATIQETGWTPLLITPFHPEYVSGHSTYSHAAATVLAANFGDDTTFATTSYTLPGVTRSFSSFTQAAEEAGRSRIYGGIHYEFTNQAGKVMGQQVGQAVLARFALAQDTQAPGIAADEMPEVSNQNVTLTGQILDNLSGVAGAQYRIDDGSLIALSLDAQGRFSITTSFVLDGTQDGAHTIDIVAFDAAGNATSGFSRSLLLDTRSPVITLESLAEGDDLDAASRIGGMADPTGSLLTALSYRIDGDAARSVVFDPETGAFDEALPLGDLAIGEHVVTLYARDAAGNETTLVRNVVLADEAPFTITGMTPANGAGDVGVTYHPQINFSRAVDATTLTEASFYATAADGTKIPARIVPANDGSYAWLFFQEPLPGASTITLHVDGNAIRAANGGLLLDADADGTAGGVLTSTFTTVSRASIPGTSLKGKVVDPGPDLEPMTFDDIRRGPDGIIHTPDDVFLLPIANAKVFILGQEDRFTFTDAFGNFELTDVPVGNVKVAIDGRTATNAPTGIFFPEMVMEAELLAGYVNTLMGTMGTLEERLANLDRQEVYLPRLSTSILQRVSDTEATTIGVTAESGSTLTDEQREFLNIEVQPGSLIGADGQVITEGQVGISAVAPELIRDMLPPLLANIPISITIQAPGVEKFAVPVALTYPNVYGAEPGSKFSLFSFDHTTGAVIFEGSATVSTDGLSITTDPGVGITKPGWHFVGVGTGIQGQPRARNDIAVLVDSGLLGDILEIDMRGTSAVDFRLVGSHIATNQAGELARIPNWEAMLIDEGKFYFVPNFSSTDMDRFDKPSSKIGELTFSARAILQGEEEKGLQAVTFRVQFKNLKPGYSTFALEGTVGQGGQNDQLELLRVQQRLRWLGFPDAQGLLSPTPEPVADLTHAIKLFQAAIDAEGDGEPSGKDGRVDPGGNTLSWLNAPHAAKWYFDVKPGAFTYQAGADRSGTSWMEEILARTNGLSVSASRYVISDISLRTGGVHPPHASHEAGMHVDVDLLMSADAAPAIYRTLGTQERIAARQYDEQGSLLPDLGYLIWTGSLDGSKEYDSISTTDSLPSGWNFVTASQFYGSVSGRPDDPRFLPNNDGSDAEVLDWVVVSTAWTTVRNELTQQFGRLLADTNDRQKPMVRSLLFVDPYFYLNEGSYPEIMYWTGHGGHYHLGIQPPASTGAGLGALRVEASAMSEASEDFKVSTAPGFGSDPRLYYRFRQSDGFEIAGRTNAMGGFTEILSPDTDFTVTFYQSSTNSSAEYSGRTNSGGQTSTIGTIILDRFGGLDTDGDGIPDVGERAIGTSATRIDSDQDGISDSAELIQGLNPLDGRPAATGIQANLLLNGQSKAVSADQVTVTNASVVAVATGSYGIAFVDVTRPDRPLTLRQVDLLGDSTDVAFDGALGYAAVASNSGGLNIVNLDGAVQNIVIDSSAVTIADGIVYTNNGSELRAYDLLTGERLQTLSLTGSRIAAMAREGDILYTIDAAHVLHAIDLSTGQMVVKDSIGVPVLKVASLFVGGGIAYVGSADNFSGGFATINVTNPNDLTLLSGIDSIDVAGRAIAANGSGLAVTVQFLGNLGNLLHVLDVSNPTVTNRVVTRYALPGAQFDPFDVVIGAGLAFVADGTSGLVVVNYRAFDNQGQVPTVTAQAEVLDLDPAAAGIQVIEGTTVRVTTTVTDDVQARNVELLLNGTVVRSDPAFPFELATVLPTIADNGSATAILTVRAIDTGGNVALSEPIEFQLVPDTVRPVLLFDNVPDDAVRGPSFRAINLRFSEAIDESTIDAASIQLIGPGGAVALSNIQFRLRGQEVQITYDTLPIGEYELRIDATRIADRAGNSLGNEVIVRHIEIAAFTNEWIAPGDGFWDVAQNWSAGHAPNVTDDVLIRVPEAATITIRGGLNEAASIVSTENIRINATELRVGSLNVSEGKISGSGSLTVTRAFSNAGGGVVLDAFGGSVTITQVEGSLHIGGEINARNVTLNAVSGGITQSTAGVLTTDTGTLSINSSGAAILTAQNRIWQFNATSDGGDIELTSVGVALLNVSGVRTTSGNVILTADNMNVVGQISAAGTVTLRPYSLTRDVRVEFEFGGGGLNLSPVELDFVSAGTLVIGRIDSQATLRVAAYVDTGNVNAETLRLLAADIEFNAGLNGINGFDHHLEARASDTVTISSGAYLGLADHRHLSLIADDDADGTGDVLIRALQAGQFSGAGVGRNAGNTGNVLLQGQNVILHNEAAGVGVSTTGVASSGGIGNITVRAVDGITFLSNGQAGTYASISTQGGNQTFQTSGVGAAGNMTLTAGSLGGAVTVFSNTGSQSLILAGSLAIRGGSGSNAFANIASNSGKQTLTVGRDISIEAGSGTGAHASIGTTADQEVTAEWIHIDARGDSFAQIAVNSPNTGTQRITTTGQDAEGRAIFIRNTGTSNAALANFGNVGGQMITVDDADRVVLIGETGQAQIFSNGTQTLTLRGTGQNRLEIGSATDTGRTQVIANGRQTIAVGTGSEAGGISIVAGLGNGFNAEIGQNATAAVEQTITTTGALVMRGGNSTGANGADARIRTSSTSGSQSISAASVSLTGGDSGTSNSAEITAASNQHVDALAGVVALTGGQGTNNLSRINQTGATALQSINALGIDLLGGADGSGNRAQITSNGTQTLTAGVEGVVVEGGSGPLYNNLAQIVQFGTATGMTQTITINDGGSIVLLGGSSATQNLGTLTGSFAQIRADGAEQLIDFTNGGTISITGGSTGDNNFANIQRNGIGAQTILGAPDVTLKAGPTGGRIDDSNSATINGREGTQNFTFGTVSLIGSDAAIDSSASITAAVQTIVVQGNLALNGGAGPVGSGARLGGANLIVEGTEISDTDLTLTVHGDLTLTGKNNGASIGSSRITDGVNNLSISVAGDIRLTPGTESAVRFGHGPTQTETSPGTIEINAGGSIVFETNEAFGGAIYSTGAVTVRSGGSIVQSGPSLQNSFVRASSLTIVADSGIDLRGGNAVSTLSLTNATSGDIVFNNATALTLKGISQTPGAGVTITSGAEISNAGTIELRGASRFSTNGSDLTNAVTGVLTGSGTFDLGTGTLINEGSLSAGTSPGTLTIDGNLELTTSSVMNVELAGGGVGQYDVVTVTGQVSGAAESPEDWGTLSLSHLSKYAPYDGGTFTVMNYASRIGSGDFSVKSFPTRFAYAGTPGSDGYVISTPGFVGLRWIGNADGFWDVGENWSGGTVPTANDDVLILRDAATVRVTVRAGNQFANSVIVAGDETLLISGGSLTLANASSADTELLVAGGVLTTNDELTVETLSLSAGTISGAGSLRVTKHYVHSGGRIALDGDLSVFQEAGELVIGGTVTAGNIALEAPAAIISEASGGTLATSGTLKLKSAGAVLSGNNAVARLDAQVGGDVQFNNSAATKLTLVGVALTEGDLEVSARDIDVIGSVTVSHGAMTLQGDDLAVLGGATLTVQGDGGQAIILTGGLSLQAGTGAAQAATIVADASQNITARYIEVLSSAGGAAYIRNNPMGGGSGTQSITTTGRNAAGYGLIVQGIGGFEAAIDNLASGAQTLTVNDADKVMVRGSSGTAQILARGDQTLLVQGTGQNLLELGSADATGASSVTTAAAQSITLGTDGQQGSLRGIGGVSDSRHAQILKTGTGSGSQTVSVAGMIELTGGSAPGSLVGTTVAGGSFAQIRNNDTASAQVVFARGITLDGGLVGIQNLAQIRAVFDQRVTVGADGITAIGGAGVIANHAGIAHRGTAGDQTIVINDGGAVVLTGGSSTDATPDAQGSDGYIRKDGSGVQRIVFDDGGSLTINGGSMGRDNIGGISATAGNQIITGMPTIGLTGGSSGGSAADGNDAHLTVSLGTQEISAQSISLSGGAGGTGNEAFINSSSDQTLVVGAGGIDLQGGAGTVSNHAVIRQFGTVGTQRITLTDGGSISVTGGASSDTAAGTAGSNGDIQANGTAQTLIFTDGGSIVMSGGSIGNDNQAFIRATAGNQEVTGVDRIEIEGGTSGATNYARILAFRNQTIAVGEGGITLRGGSGVVSNHADIQQTGSIGTQTISIDDGGALRIFAGSSSDTTVGTGGSNGDVSANGGAQRIDFLDGGVIEMIGGTLGAGNQAFIRSTNGTQAITGSPEVTIRGGASGGTTDDANNASIHADVSQELVFGETTLIGATGGVDNSASITAQLQRITIDGNLSLTGGDNGTGGTRIGGRGTTGAETNTDLVLTIHGDLQLRAGATNSASIGTDAQATGVTNAITIRTDGDVLLSPSATQGIRIGSPAGDVRNGAISIAAMGDITLMNGGGTGLAVIRTLGSVELLATGAGSAIIQAEGSIIRAADLVATADAGISLLGNNQVAAFSASNATANAIELNNTATTLTLNGIAQAAGANIGVATSGAIVNAGTILLSGGSVLTTNGRALTNAAGGVVRGAGVIDLGGPGSIFTNAGLVEAGTSAGTLRINADFVMTTGIVDLGPLGSLVLTGSYTGSALGQIRLNLFDLDSFGRIEASGSMSLAGLLSIEREDGFVPGLGAGFQFATMASRSGSFATITGTDLGNGTILKINATSPVALAIDVSPA